MDVDFRTQAIHAGYEPLDNGRAAVPPIYASAAFDLGDAARGDALAGGARGGLVLEGQEAGEALLEGGQGAGWPLALEDDAHPAALEDGIGAVAVGSGMAAAY